MPSSRKLAALLVIAFAFVMSIAACGDSSEDASSADVGATAGAADRTGDTPARTATTTPASDAAQVKQLILETQKAYGQGDGETVCPTMTAAGERDLLEYARIYLRDPDASCVEVIRKIAEQRPPDSIEEPITVLKVRVRGDRARALVRTPNVKPIWRPYVRENGEWKNPPFGLAAAVGGASR